MRYLVKYTMRDGQWTQREAVDREYAFEVFEKCKLEPEIVSASIIDLYFSGRELVSWTRDERLSPEYDAALAAQREIMDEFYTTFQNVPQHEVLAILAREVAQYGGLFFATLPPHLHEKAIGGIVKLFEDLLRGSLQAAQVVLPANNNGPTE